eukprot:UN28450
MGEWARTPRGYSLPRLIEPAFQSSMPFASLALQAAQKMHSQTPGSYHAQIGRETAPRGPKREKGSAIPQAQIVKRTVVPRVLSLCEGQHRLVFSFDHTCRLSYE